MKLFWYEAEADRNEHLIFVKRNVERDRPMSVLPHIHNSIELAFGIEGTSCVYINEKRYSLDSSHAYFINSFERHQYEYKAGSKVFIIVISSSLFSSEGGLSFPTVLNNCSVNEKIKEFLEFSYSSKNRESLVFKIGFVNMLLSLLMDAYPYREEKAQRGSEIIMRVMRYVSENFKKDITIGELAKIFGYSPNYLSMLFNKYVGMSFKEHLNRCRLAEYVALRISQPDLPICKAAELSGFSSTSMFYYTLDKIKKDEKHFDMDLLKQQ